MRTWQPDWGTKGYYNVSWNPKNQNAKCKQKGSRRESKKSRVMQKQRTNHQAIGKKKQGHMKYTTTNIKSRDRLLRFYPSSTHASCRDVNKTGTSSQLANAHNTYFQCNSIWCMTYICNLGLRRPKGRVRQAVVSWLQSATTPLNGTKSFILDL